MVSGTYYLYSEKGVDVNPYVLLYNRCDSSQSIIKAFKSPHLVTSIGYGPYDNGHVLVGMENGIVIAFSAVDMAKIF